MKVKLPGGVMLDVLNRQELAEELACFLEDARRLFVQEKRDRVKAQRQTATDATGAGSVNVYETKLGMIFRLARVVVSADGFSYAAPFTNVAGMVEIRRNGQLVSGFNLADGIPNVWRASSDARPQFMNGEVVTVDIVGGPASTNFTVVAEGDLYPRQ